MADKTRILVIDDEKNYLIVMEALLSDAGYEVTALNDPEMALHYLEEAEVDLVITDMKMPKMTGKEVLQRIKKSWPHLPVLIMTAFGSIESAVDAMRYGAFDYITKPFSNDDMLLSVHNAAELSKAHQQYKILQETLEERYKPYRIIGKSKQIKDLLAIIDRIAISRANVLITGESGSGKETVARAIHFSSSRKKNPFVTVNCMAFNSSMLENELFGYEQETFNGVSASRRGRIEQADTGTLFLDEISGMSLDLQIKFLHVLQDRRLERMGGTTNIKTDIRVIVASTQNLAKLVEEGKFREDLYYQLNIVELKLPPLRERREDIPLLIAHLSDKIEEDNGITPKSFSKEALNYLTGYDWPGNIRQLQNILERCLVMVPHQVITVDDLPPEIRDEDAQFKSAVDLLPVEMNLPDTMDRIEAAVVRRALIRANFVQSQAADLLGISRSLMQYKMKKFNINL